MNKLIAFPNIEAFPTYSNSAQIGKSLFIKKSLQYTGVDATTGLYTFKDVNGDGAISVLEDGLFLKEVSQKFFGGINNNFSYKGFELSFLLQFVKQTGYSFEKEFVAPGRPSNQPVEILNRWQKAGDISTKQQYTFIGSGNETYSNYLSSDALIVNASFIRLKNASLSWTLPSKLIQKSFLSGSRVFVQAQNLFTITNYIGLDPETQSQQALPPLRVITAGIQFTL